MIDKDQQNEQLKKRIVAHQSEIDSVQADINVLTELSDFAKQHGEHYQNSSTDFASRHEADHQSLSVKEKRAYVENLHLQVAFRSVLFKIPADGLLLYVYFEKAI